MRGDPLSGKISTLPIDNTLLKIQNGAERRRDFRKWGVQATSARVKNDERTVYKPFRSSKCQKTSKGLYMATDKVNKAPPQKKRAKMVKRDYKTVRRHACLHKSA